NRISATDPNRMTGTIGVDYNPFTLERFSRIKASQLRVRDFDCPFWKWWQTATANASVASSNLGTSLMRKRLISIFATCSLDAFPLPVTDCFTLRGAYSLMGTSRNSAADMATPCARPNFNID